jgi:ribosome-binding protein aMBF1 (putative translation factor)
MSAHTKRPHTRRIHKTKQIKEKTIPWREVFKDEIEKFGEPAIALRGARHRENMSQQELADKLAIEQHHISEMENEKRPIGKAMAKRLAEIFDVDYRVFL